MTLNYRCIGKGTTDSNGVAHITHDCSGNALSDDGYTGVGAGLLNVVASTDGPSDISESSFQSETYEVLDTLYYDGMTSDTSSNYFTNSDHSLVFDSDKLRLTRVSDGDCYAQYEPNSVATYKGKTVKFECDINGITQTRLRIYQFVNGSFSNVGGDFITTGTASVSATIDANTTRVLFRVDGRNLGTDGTLTFKNFKVYPI